MIRFVVVIEYCPISENAWQGRTTLSTRQRPSLRPPRARTSFDFFRLLFLPSHARVSSRLVSFRTPARLPACLWGKAGGSKRLDEGLCIIARLLSPLPTGPATPASQLRLVARAEKHCGPWLDSTITRTHRLE